MNQIMKTSITRRHFVVASASAAGGLAISVAFPGLADAASIGAQAWGPESTPNEINAFLAIDPDGSILIRSPHQEMGQGAITALPMIVAEELECDWSKVKVEYASPARNLREKNVYGEMTTVGSRGVRTSWQMLLQAGASARERLVAAAAQRWNVSPSDCEAANSKITHKATGRSFDYGALAADAANIKLDKEPAIRTPDQFKLIGKRIARLDTPLKINGSAKFAIDTKVPDMVYAAVSACPVFGGRLKSVDEGPAKGRRGVLQVVKLDNAVVVVADRFWRAKEALALLKPEWDVGEAGNTDSAQFAKLYRDTLDGPMVSARNDGNVDDAFGKGGKFVEAVYEAPHLAHATMEPLNATVHLQPDKLEVWLGSQTPMGTLRQAAAASGLKPEQIVIHNCFLGGGFGRRSINDEMRQAILVAKEVGKPVKLVWTREEDMTQDRYRPQAAVRMKTALGSDGMPTAFDAKIAVGSILRSTGINKVENGIEAQAVEGFANIPYAIPSVRVGCMLKNTHVPVMFWRSVGSSQNAFFVESYIDELAQAAGQDPYKFRRTLLAGKSDFLGVLDTIAEKSDWGKPLGQGRGRGIAIHECYGSIIGQVAEVTVSQKGEVKVDRVVAAVDCGHVVNPGIVEAQIQSGVIYGLSAALYGEITIKQGRVEQGNFDEYQVMRLADTPKIEVYLALSGGKKWGGIGEPGTAATAPAVANAVFAATGTRVRSMPLKNVKLPGPV
ncbi:MAG TPA: xanthine dehydrogenase family protein molybdopterin-binding subunit [Pseudolabrys sp.]|jgi:isoquinoline 1-oxidoreductase beta subunit|nr:xanthine dehydrogenase family protein molybdopterin-binding subunit [Pseudolabrys sp.]